MFIIFCLLCLYFLKFTFFCRYCKYFILPDVSYLCLGCKKKLVVFRWTNSNLDRAISKDFWFQVSANIYRQQPQFLYLTYLLTVTVSLTVLYEKEFNSTWILKYSRSITSTMFINNKTILRLLTLRLYFAYYAYDSV